MAKPPVYCIPDAPQFSGTLLICGSAACLFDDLAAARVIRPDSHTMLINGAAQLVLKAEHVLAGHGDKADDFMAQRRKKFPDAPAVMVHASINGARDIGKCVTHIWRHVNTGGTSAWKAVRIGKAMGYSEIILCGCPMDDSGYAQGESDGITHACARIGLGEGRMYDNYRRTFAVRAQQEGQGVYSMSGYSRQLLGAPAGAVRAA